MCVNLRSSVYSFKSILSASALRCRFCSSVTCVDKRGMRTSPFASYLMQNFGFTRTSAAQTASKFRGYSLEDANSVVSLFKEHGFSNKQVSKIVRQIPQTLKSNPTVIKPKIDFLLSKFEDSLEVAHVFSSYPLLLHCSLEKRLIPSFNFLSTIFKSERDAAFELRRVAAALMITPDSSAAKMLEILVESGVPNSKLLLLFRYHCVTVANWPGFYEETVENVRRMGFNPKTSNFVVAFRVLVGLTKQSWEAKVNMFKECGWSEEEFLTAFRRNPHIGLYSDVKVKLTFKFIREMGLEPSVVARYPQVIGHSLEKRIIPRAYIAQFLRSKGLRHNIDNLCSLFCASDSTFTKTHILPYDKVHGVAKLYDEKMKLACRKSKPP